MTQSGKWRFSRVTSCSTVVSWHAHGTTTAPATYYVRFPGRAGPTEAHSSAHALMSCDKSARGSIRGVMHPPPVRRPIGYARQCPVSPQYTAARSAEGLGVQHPIIGPFSIDATEYNDTKVGRV
jgi:hypothetical protein